MMLNGETAVAIKATDLHEFGDFFNKDNISTWQNVLVLSNNHNAAIKLLTIYHIGHNLH